jgi:hypothetical protein
MIYESTIILYRRSQYDTYEQALEVNGVSVFRAFYEDETVNMLKSLCRMAELMEHQSSEKDIRVRIIINENTENQHLNEYYLSEAEEKLIAYLYNF